MTTIRSASSVLLVRELPPASESLLQLYTIVRPDTMRFLPGFTVFPGGAAEDEDESLEWDAHVTSAICHHPLLAEMAVSETDALALPTGKRTQSSVITAIREVFEETGALIGQKPGPDYLHPHCLADNRQALLDQKMTFLDMIKALQIQLDFQQICYAGRRLTPPASPIRYNTTFYVTVLPSEIQMLPSPSEVAADAWLEPSLASELWKRREILCARPTRECFAALTLRSAQKKLLEKIRNP